MYRVAISSGAATRRSGGLFVAATRFRSGGGPMPPYVPPPFPFKHHKSGAGLNTFPPTQDAMDPMLDPNYNYSGAGLNQPPPPSTPPPRPAFRERPKEKRTSLYERFFGSREREQWEFEPTEKHRALILTLYRNLLKELVTLQTVRRRSLVAYCRMAFRRRANATEKFLIDECVEEARRAIYVSNKLNRFVVTKEYEFDSMYLPKDTGQDVKSFMEKVFDPRQARANAQSMTRDVVPGREDEHQRMFKPKSRTRDMEFKDSTHDVFRPPPPPQA